MCIIYREIYHGVNLNFMVFWRFLDGCHSVARGNQIVYPMLNDQNSGFFKANYNLMLSVTMLCFEKDWVQIELFLEISG